MSLRVWLPLTKDLRNQGLDDVTVTNNGATYNATGGKLGGCYNFTNQNIVVPSNSFKNEFTNNQASLAVWVKVTTSHNAYAQALVLGTQGTSWINILFGIDINSSGTPIANASTGNAYTNLSFATTIKDGKWHHLAYTYNNGTMKAYVDGVQNSTTTTSNVPAWTSSTNLYIGGNTAGEKFRNGDSMNDVRVYNHCLSPMEVKRLARGLVLHYSLNRDGFGGENLILESHKVTGGSQSSGITRTYESDGSMKIVSTSGNGGWCALGFAKDSNTSVENNMAVGDTYCISCDVKIETGTALPTLFINSGNGYKQLKPVHGSIITNKWMRVYYTSTWAEPGTSSYGNISLHLSFSSAIGTYYFKNFKLEKGSIPTPWCPNSSDELASTLGLNSTTEYDTSGFGNNGTRTGTFSWTSDTPKYTVSTNFSGTETIATATTGADILTLSCWAKTSKSKSTSQMMVADSASKLCCSFYQGNFISFYGGSSGSDTGSRCFLGSEYKENEWNHFVSVKTGEGTRDCYCNGVKLTPTTNDWWGTVAGFYIGNRNSDGNIPFYGQICDVRAYATALSADDVKSLYQNSAYIDSSGNVYGTIHES